MADQPDKSPPAEAMWCNVDFDTFYRFDANRIVAYLLKLGASPAEAEDSAQHALAAVFTKWEHLRATNPPAYARTVAFRHYVGSRVRLAEEEDRLKRSDWANERPVAGPEHTLILREEQRMLIEAMQILPFEQRRVLALHLDRFTTAEIAEIAGAKEGTVRSNLRHAKTKVRQHMADKRKATTSGGRADDEQLGR